MHKNKKSPWARRRRRVFLILLLIALLISPVFIWRFRLKSEMRQEMAAVKALGVPVSGPEYVAWTGKFPTLPVVEACRQAASAYVQIPFEVSSNFPAFRARHESEELFAVPYDAATLDAMRQLVTVNGESLRLIHEVRSRGVVGSGEGRGRSSEALVELCCAAACVRAADGDGAGALDAVLNGLVFLRVHYALPWSHSLWRSSNELGQLMRALASAAARTPLPEDKLREIQALLVAPDWENEMRLSTIDRTAIMIQDFPEFQPDVPAARIADLVFGIFDRQMAESMRSRRMLLELIGKSIKEQEAAFAQIEERGWWRDFNYSGPPIHLAVASAGIELVCHYQRTGTLPDTLDALAREGLDLSDFFSGGNLQYKREGDRVTIYSVGNDLKDGGGDGRSDIVFQAVLPAK